MRIKFKKIKEKILKLPREMVKRKLFSFFLFFFFSFLISLLVFLKYNLLIQKKEILPPKIQKLDTSSLEKILKIWQEKKEKSN